MTPPPRLPESVVAALLAVRRRRRLLAFVESVGLVAGGVVALLLMSPLAIWLPDAGLPAARVVARLWLVVAVAGPVLAVLIPAWRRTGSLLSVARAVDDRVPETRASLFAAIDLQQAAEGGAFADEAQLRLVQLHFDQASTASAAVDPASLLPWSSLGRRTAAGPALLLALSGLVAAGPAGLDAGWQRLFGPLPTPETLAEDEIADVADLTLRNLRIELTPPAYSGRSPLVLEGTTGDFQAMAGTRVDVRATVEGARGAATLVVSGGEAVNAKLSSGRLDGTFTVPGGGFWRLEVARGLGVSRSRKFRVEVIPDRPPDLQVSAPSLAELRPEASLAVGVDTTDDFGLSRVELVVEKGGRELARRPLADVDNDPSWQGEGTFVPRDWIGEQGGELALVVESWDNDTARGPKVTRSRAVEAYVPTARDHHKKSLALKQQLLARTLDLLAAVLVDGAAAFGRVEVATVNAQHRRHRDGMSGLLKTGGELVEAMAVDSLEDRAVYLGISQLLDNVARTWTPLDDLVADRLEGSHRLYADRGILAQLSTRRDALSDELERVVLDLDAFVSLHQGGEALDRVSNLEPGMARLADLLRQADEGKPVSAELTAAFDELQRRLEDLARSLMERSGGPDDGFMNQMPQEMGEDRMAQIAKAMEEGRFDDALEMLQEAMDAVAQTEEALQQEAQDMAGAQVAQELQQQLQEGIDRAKELEAQQQAVIDDTDQLQERFGTGDGLEPDAVASLDAAIQELRDRIADVPPDSLQGADGNAVRSWERMALRQAIRLQEAWDEGSLGEAADHAEMTGADLSEMARELGNTQQGNSADNRAAEQRALDAQAQAQDIAEQMHQAVRQAARARQQAAGASQGVQEQQKQVAEGVGQLRRQMGEVGGSAFNPAAGRQQLEGAEQLMERAGSQLRQGRSGRALAAEQDALRQLQGYRESLEGAQQAMKPGQRMGPGQPGSRPGYAGGMMEAPGDNGDGQPKGGDVELTDPDDFLTPEALRALLQEGAADDAPERYRPLNRGYYEELAR